MAGTTNSNDEAKATPMTDEADIGSGEKTPAQLETEEQIRQIPALPGSGAAPTPGSKDGGPTAGGARGV